MIQLFRRLLTIDSLRIEFKICSICISISIVVCINLKYKSLTKKKQTLNIKLDIEIGSYGTNQSVILSSSSKEAVNPIAKKEKFYSVINRLRVS